MAASSHASGLKSTPTPRHAEALRGADQEARVSAAEVDDVTEVDAAQDLDRIGRDVVAADQRGAFGDPAAGALDVAAVAALAGDEVAEAGEHVPVAALQPHEVALVLDDRAAVLGEGEGAVALLRQLALREVAQRGRHQAVRVGDALRRSCHRPGLQGGEQPGLVERGEHAGEREALEQFEHGPLLDGGVHGGHPILIPLDRPPTPPPRRPASYMPGRPVSSSAASGATIAVITKIVAGRALDAVGRGRLTSAQ